MQHGGNGRDGGGGEEARVAGGAYAGHAAFDAFQQQLSAASMGGANAAQLAAMHTALQRNSGGAAAGPGSGRPGQMGSGTARDGAHTAPAAAGSGFSFTGAARGPTGWTPEQRPDLGQQQSLGRGVPPVLEVIGSAADTAQFRRPVAVTLDENTLFRAVSMALWGNESMWLTLRIRTAEEAMARPGAYEALSPQVILRLTSNETVPVAVLPALATVLQRPIVLHLTDICRSFDPIGTVLRGARAVHLTTLTLADFARPVTDAIALVPIPVLHAAGRGGDEESATPPAIVTCKCYFVGMIDSSLAGNGVLPTINGIPQQPDGRMPQQHPGSAGEAMNSAYGSALAYSSAAAAGAAVGQMPGYGAPDTFAQRNSAAAKAFMTAANVASTYQSNTQHSQSMATTDALRILTSVPPTTLIMTAANLGISDSFAKGDAAAVNAVAAVLSSVSQDPADKDKTYGFDLWHGKSNQAVISNMQEQLRKVSARKSGQCTCPRGCQDCPCSCNKCRQRKYRLRQARKREAAKLRGRQNRANSAVSGSAGRSHDDNGNEERDDDLEEVAEDLDLPASAAAEAAAAGAEQEVAAASRRSVVTAEDDGGEAARGGGDALGNTGNGAHADASGANDGERGSSDGAKAGDGEQVSGTRRRVRKRR